MNEPDNLSEIEKLKSEIKRLKDIIREHTAPLEVLLRRRGFRIYRKEPSDDLLLPEVPYLDGFYEMLKKYSFRLFLRDVIKHQEGFRLENVTRYATKEVTGEYIHYLLETGLIEKTSREYFRLKKRIKSFGETLEWFFSEILKREFGMESTWGLSFKIPGTGGDYDVIGKFDSSILYAEVKSSPPKQIYQNEIRAFLRRIESLMPEMAIFFMDTELRMKDKIVPMFEEELKASKKEVTRITKELFHIDNSIFIVNAKDSIVNNIEIVFSWYHKNMISRRRHHGYD